MFFGRGTVEMIDNHGGTKTQVKVINSGGTARNYNRAPILTEQGAKKIHILLVPKKTKKGPKCYL